MCRYASTARRRQIFIDSNVGESTRSPLQIAKENTLLLAEPGSGANFIDIFSGDLSATISLNYHALSVNRKFKTWFTDILAVMLHESLHLCVNGQILRIMVTRVKSDIYLYENFPCVENVLYILKYLSAKTRIIAETTLCCRPQAFLFKDCLEGIFWWMLQNLLCLMVTSIFYTSNWNKS